MASNSRSGRSSRDELLKAFISSSKNRRKLQTQQFKYRPLGRGALPPMEGAFKAQSSRTPTPRVKRGRYRPVKGTGY